MRRLRRLGAEEARLWRQVAATVTPLHGIPAPKHAPDQVPRDSGAGTARMQPVAPRQPVPGPSARPDEVSRPLDRLGLDGSWERKVARGGLRPDFTLDLHGLGLDAAYRRLEHGLALAIAQDARIVLVISGRPRPVDAADRGGRRGAIRAKLIDWLAAGTHATRIAAVRPAHQKHGGAGAVYVILKRIR